MQCLIWKIIRLQKIFRERVLSYSTHGAQGIAQTIRLPCKLIILLVGRFEGPTEVELNNLWKTVYLWSIVDW